MWPRLASVPNLRIPLNIALNIAPCVVVIQHGVPILPNPTTRWVWRHELYCVGHVSELQRWYSSCMV